MKMKVKDGMLNKKGRGKKKSEMYCSKKEERKRLKSTVASKRKEKE